MTAAADVRKGQTNMSYKGEHQHSITKYETPNLFW